MPPEDEIINNNQPLRIPEMEQVAPSEQNRINAKNQLRNFVELADGHMSGQEWTELKEKILQYCDMNVGPYCKRGQREAEINLFKQIMAGVRPMVEQKTAAYDTLAMELEPEEGTAREEYQRREHSAHQELTTASYLLSWFENRNDGDMARMTRDSKKLKKEELLEARDRVLSLKEDTKMVRVPADEPLFPHDPCMGDLMQGAVGDCYLLTGLGILCNRNPEKIKEMIRDNHDGTVTVRLFRKNDEGRPEPLYIHMDKSIPKKEKYKEYEDTKVYYGDLYGQGTLWVQLIEKAYALSAQHIKQNEAQKKNDHPKVNPRIHQVYDEFEQQAFPKLVELVTDEARRGELQAAFQAELTYRGDPLNHQAPDPRPSLDNLIKELSDAGIKKADVDNALKKVTRPDRKLYPELYPGKPGTLPRRYHVSYNDISGGIPSDFVDMILGEEMPVFSRAESSDYLSWRQGEKRIYAPEDPTFIADMKKYLAGNPPATPQERLNYLWDKFQALETAGENPSNLNKLKKDLGKFLEKTGENKGISPEFKNLCLRISGAAEIKREDMEEFITALGASQEPEEVRNGFDSMLKERISGYKERVERDVAIQLRTNIDFVRQNFRDSLQGRLDSILAANMQPETDIREYNDSVRAMRFFRAHELDPLYAEAVSHYLITGELPPTDRYGKLSDREPMASHAEAYRRIVNMTAREGIRWDRGPDPHFRLVDIKLPPEADPDINQGMPALVNLLNRVANKDQVKPSGPRELGNYLPEENALYRKLAMLTDPEKKHGSFVVAAGSRKPWNASEEPIPGVYTGHAYGVLGVRERKINGKPYKFVKLRNPHGMGCREYFVNDQKKLEGRRMVEAVPNHEVPKPGVNDGYEQHGYFELELSEFASMFPSLSVNKSTDCDKAMRNIALKDGVSPICTDYQELLNRFCEVLDGTNHGLRRDTDAYKNMLKAVDDARRSLMGKENLTHQELKDLFAPVAQAAETYLSTHADRKRNERMEIRYQTADTLCRLNRAFSKEEAFKNPGEAMKQALMQQIGEKMVEGLVLQDKEFSYSLAKSQDAGKKNTLNKIRAAAARVVKMDNVKMALEDLSTEQLQQMANNMNHKQLIVTVKGYRSDSVQHTPAQAARTNGIQAAQPQGAQASRPRSNSVTGKKAGSAKAKEEQETRPRSNSVTTKNTGGKGF